VDLETLAVFINKVRYRRPVYLVYGAETDKAFLARIELHAERIESLPPVEVWFHREPGSAAEHCQTLKPL
jgi:hypothetical protein